MAGDPLQRERPARLRGPPDPGGRRPRALGRAARVGVARHDGQVACPRCDFRMREDYQGRSSRVDLCTAWRRHSKARPFACGNLPIAIAHADRILNGHSAPDRAREVMPGPRRRRQAPRIHSIESPIRGGVPDGRRPFGQRQRRGGFQSEPSLMLLHTAATSHRGRREGRRGSHKSTIGMKEVFQMSRRYHPAFLPALLLALGLLAVAAPAPAQVPLDPSLLPKFDVPMTQPPILDGTATSSATPLQIHMSEFQQMILPPAFYPPAFSAGTYLWGYNGIYPGPTVAALRGTPTWVHYFNDLKSTDGSPLFLQNSIKVDETIHWANPLGSAPSMDQYLGPAPACVHLHGGEVPSAYDGGPNAWWTPDFAQKGPGYVTDLYQYPNQQENTTLFYHDHVLGMTRTNLYSGLAGFYLLLDPAAEAQSSGRQRGRRDRPVRQSLSARRGDPGPHVRHRRPALLARRQPQSGAFVLAAGILRGRHPGERQAVALPERRAAPLSPAHAGRVECALLPDATRESRPQHARTLVLADRHRRRTAGPAGSALRPDQPDLAAAPDRAWRAGRHRHRLLGLRGAEPDAGQRRPGAIPGRGLRGRSDQRDHAVPGRHHGHGRQRSDARRLDVACRFAPPRSSVRRSRASRAP